MVVTQNNEIPMNHSWASLSIVQTSDSRFNSRECFNQFSRLPWHFLAKPQGIL